MLVWVIRLTLRALKVGAILLLWIAWAESYGYAGISEQSFCPEPTAATISFLHNNPQSNDELVLTVDFGGGTLDFSVLRRDGSAFQVQATHGVALGGDRIDQTIFQRSYCFHCWGKGERWRRIIDGSENRHCFSIWRF